VSLYHQNPLRGPRYSSDLLHLCSDMERPLRFPLGGREFATVLYQLPSSCTSSTSSAAPPPGGLGPLPMTMRGGAPRTGSVPPPLTCPRQCMPVWMAGTRRSSLSWCPGAAAAPPGVTPWGLQPCGQAAAGGALADHGAGCREAPARWNGLPNHPRAMLRDAHRVRAGSGGAAVGVAGPLLLDG
jgi:hydroxymethylglutaryl-CoA reductase (NADPH)